MGVAKKKKNHRIVGEWSVVILIAFIASVAILFSLGNRGLHQRLEERRRFEVRHSRKRKSAISRMSILRRLPEKNLVLYIRMRLY